MILILILNALFAITFNLGKEVVSVVPPIFFLGVRMVLAGLLLLGFVRFYKKDSLKIDKKDYGNFFIIIFFHIYASYIGEFVSLQYVPSSKVALLFNLSPFITALLCYFIFGQKLSKKQFIGLCIGFLGFLPLILFTSSDVNAVNMALAPIDLMLLMAITTACIGWITMDTLTTNNRYSFFFVNSVGMIGGGFLCLLTSYATETWPSLQFACTNTIFLKNLFLLILIGNVICYNLYGFLLKKYSATLLSFFGATIPLFSALFGWLWYNEIVGWPFFLTFICVTTGLYIFYKEELPKKFVI